MNQQELSKILEQHKLWVKSDGKQGKRIALDRLNLRDRDLVGADLREADIRRSDLRNVDFRGADLSGADFEDSILRGANLLGADFTSADLTGAKFDLNFREVGWFSYATVSKDQLCWLALHPHYSEFADTLTVV